MSDETQQDPPAEEPKPEPPKAQWEYKKNFAINDKMKDIVKKTMTVTEMEIDMLRKKLDRLTYGG